MKKEWKHCDSLCSACRENGALPLVKATANTAREFALSILLIDTQKTHESMRIAQVKETPIREIRFSRDVPETCTKES